MSLKERVYSVLIVSAAESFNDALSALLPNSKYSPTHFVSNVSAAKRALAERAYDLCGTLRSQKQAGLARSRQYQPV